MKNTDALRDWVEQFSAAEKRFVHLLGKTRAGSKGSELLDLWSWLLKSKQGDEVPANLQRNILTNLKRLRKHVLEALRMLDQQNAPNSKLLKILHSAQILFERGLNEAAKYQCERAIALSQDLCRYEIQLQAYQFLRKMDSTKHEPDVVLVMQDLAEKELQAMNKMANLLALRQMHDELIANGSQAFSGQNAFVGTKLSTPEALQYLELQFNEGSWLERSLAGNILGILEIFSKHYPTAFERYSQILTLWHSVPDRQKEEINLFINICKNFQSASFLSPCDLEEQKRRLDLLPSFSNLPPAFDTKHQYLIYRERLSWVISSSSFDLLQDLQRDLLPWLKENWDGMGESRALAISFNLATLTFINEQFSDALVILALILGKGKKLARKDIRDFSLVFQAVMHFELGHEDLNEYLIRSARRKFSKHSNSDQFEMAVLKCLSDCTRSRSDAENVQHFEKLYQDLLALEKQLDARLQVVGLSEIMIWCEARMTGRSIKEVYHATLQEMSNGKESQ